MTGRAMPVMTTTTMMESLIAGTTAAWCPTLTRRMQTVRGRGLCTGGVVICWGGRDQQLGGRGLELNLPPVRGRRGRRMPG
jgi:hypothetical protein